MEEQEEFYNPYLGKVPADEAVSALVDNLDECAEVFSEMGEDHSKYRYAEGKWSLREILGHMIDGERVFAYRAMSIARGEKQALPGFEENDYADNSNAHEREITSLWNEFYHVRTSTILMFQSFSKEMLDSVGTMNNSRFSVKSIGRIITGHTRHHLEVIKDRYQKDMA